MKSKKTVILASAMLAVISVVGFTINGIKISSLTKETQKEIEIEKQEVANEEEKLQELQEELKNIDSPEYIKKIAEEQLGMVEEDTIVFRQKNK